jgi:hypothetical protein
MKATDFQRDDCLVGKKRKSYDTLTREWRCKCGGRLVMLGSVGDDRYPENWYVACGACGGHDHDFVHEAKVQRQKSEASEVLASLPNSVAAAMGYERPATDGCVIIFSLSPLPEFEI